jgi:uncharacterized protein YcbK (DUF882 family)
VTWLRFVPCAIAALASASVSTASARDVAPARSMMLDSKKSVARADDDSKDLLATIAQTHTDEHVVLDDASPTQARFDALLADRVTGQSHAIDPRLLDMLRRIARLHASSGVVRIEIVSGFRSEKLNETLRKKGHHVATHSQHTLGHAVDFRVVTDDGAIDPREIERELRGDLQWDGGVGVYLSEGDRFTHADVGPNRRWNGL